MITGVITALATPMCNNHDIDYSSVEKLLCQQLNAGIKSIVIAGSTGEGSSLSAQEKITLIKFVINYTSNIKYIVAINALSTNSYCQFINDINNIKDIDALLVTAPPYVKPNQDGIYHHFSVIAKLSKKPIIIYNVPLRTSCDINNNTVLKLAKKYNNIVGLKDATGNLSRFNEFIAYKPDQFKLYSGDDATALPFILNGGDGVISVISNLIPCKFNKLINLALYSKIQDAVLLNNKISFLYNKLYIESNPVPLKWLLYKLQLIQTPHVRLPLVMLDEYKQDLLNCLIEEFKNDT